ncbi:MAG: glycoside hydrolase family 20 zincin-like fold domain-containing protein [Chitinophagaceae bacterium]
MLKKIFLCTFLNALDCAAAAQTTSQLIPKKGLYVTTNNLTWITGSEINFFTTDKKHHHYYFTWWEQDELRKQHGTALQIGSKNTAVHGTYSLLQEQKDISTFINCQWNQNDTALADVVYAKLWLPFLSNAVWAGLDNVNITDITKFTGNGVFLKTPFGNYFFQSSHPFKIKQQANLQPGKSEYAVRSQYLLIYEENIKVNKTSGLNRSLTITEVKAVDAVQKTAITKNIQLQRKNEIWNSNNQLHPLLPQPKFMELKNEYYIIPLNKPSTLSTVAQQYRNSLQLYWHIGNHYFPNIQTQQNNFLADEGYTIDINKNLISIQYKSAQGLQHAIHTLVQLTKNENGQLVIPQGIIRDEPSVAWRGIHMFTGPTSWQLHKRMYDRILFPLKMNKVVLQCEQAQWKSRPELHNSTSVPMKDLKDEFDYLRKYHNEPIPLIQSLGHMEWFFKPKQNRFMAVNPQYPYTLNPDLPQSQKAVKQLWDETFALLKPTTMHIGFDEIGMIGFNEPREKEVKYFKTQINFLHNYAQQKNAKLMLWGDMGLAPGEGPDALNGISKERAATIRSFIPKESYVADWHYINNPNPEIYKINLQIWKQNNNLPLASPWLWPNNVRGFVHAAIDENAGVLQTTWADFESSEKNMLLNIEQFGAYILAMDYAWSGRKELPEQLPYNATEEWATRFYSQAKPVENKNGWRIIEPMQFQNSTSAEQMNLPVAYKFNWSSIASSGFVLKATTETILQEGTPVAEILFYSNKQLVYKKQLRYGVDVRSATDARMNFAHTKGKDEKTLYQFFQKQLNITGIEIKNLHPASGMKINEMVLVE